MHVCMFRETQCPTPRKPEKNWMASHQNPLNLLVTVCTSFSCLCGNLWTNAQRYINDFVWKITRHVDNFVKIADKTLRKICGNAAFPPSHWPIHFAASYWSNLRAFIFIAFGTLWYKIQESLDSTTAEQRPRAALPSASQMLLHWNNQIIDFMWKVLIS